MSTGFYESLSSSHYISVFFLSFSNFHGLSISLVHSLALLELCSIHRYANWESRPTTDSWKSDMLTRRITWEWYDEEVMRCCWLWIEAGATTGKFESYMCIR